MKKFQVLMLAALSFAANADAAGTATAEFLKVSPDSRSAALGGTGVADASSGFTVFHNPGLMGQEKSRVKAAGGQMQWLLGSTAGHYAASTRFETAAGTAWAVGVSYSRWDVPSFAATDAQGNAAGTVGYAAQTTGLAVSRSFTKTIHAGLGMKRVTQAFTGAAQGAGGAGTAWDAGVSYLSESGRWSAGAAAMNMGKSGDEEFPSSWRAGLESRFAEGRFSWTLEGARQAEGKTTVNAGLGFNPLPSLSVRAGYDARVAGADYAGLTSGVGMTWGDMRLDYAFTPFGEAGTAQRVSLSWAMKARPSEITKERRAPRPKAKTRRYDRWSNEIYGGKK